MHHARSSAYGEIGAEVPECECGSVQRQKTRDARKGSEILVDKCGLIERSLSEVANIEEKCIIIDGVENV